jgi:hypothetical protein
MPTPSLFFLFFAFICAVLFISSHFQPLLFHWALHPGPNVQVSRRQSFPLSVHESLHIINGMGHPTTSEVDVAANPSAAPSSQFPEVLDHVEAPVRKEFVRSVGARVVVTAVVGSLDAQTGQPAVSQPKSKRQIKRVSGDTRACMHTQPSL